MKILITEGGNKLRIKIQDSRFELNIKNLETEHIFRLHKINEADWSERKTIEGGISAGAPAFWAYDEETKQVSVLVGSDDESWDFRISVDYDYFLQEINRFIYDKLDVMINLYNSMDKNVSFGKRLDCFFECFSYVVQLENHGALVKSANGQYDISYLKDILDNDGPEYSLTIGFANPYEGTSSYEIGVCVRGTPIIRKVDNNPL